MIGRLDVATDARGVLDLLLNGQADVGIIFGPDAYDKRERVRVVAVAPEQAIRPIIHSMAMERYCPDRPLCEELRFPSLQKVSSEGIAMDAWTTQVARRNIFG
jgi:molybdate transport system substrate-binding protein